MTERPLHVRVADALGYHCVQHSDGAWRTEAGNVVFKVLRYDKSWCATGPLIEKYGITVGRFRPDFFEGKAYAVLPGIDTPDARGEAHGDTPLLAVCHLILTLHKAGKLHP